MACRTTGKGATERRRYAVAAVVCICASSFTGCGSEATSVPAGPANQAALGGNVAIAWDTNRETAVNRPGGGYRVYYGVGAGFSIANAPFVDVPYTDGAAAPTRAGLSLPAGRYFIKVVAYSSLNPTGSEPSAEIAVTVPSAPAGIARAP